MAKLEHVHAIIMTDRGDRVYAYDEEDIAHYVEQFGRYADRGQIYVFRKAEIA